MADPKIAVDTILETEADVSGVTVYPLTIARYGLLELLDSPLVDPTKDFSILEAIPALYVMTQPISALKKWSSKNVEELRDTALEASETWTQDQLGQMFNLVMEKIARVSKVAPQGDDDGDGTKKKDQLQPMA